MNDLFASYYELFYYAADFSEEMFGRYLYQRYALISFVIALVVPLLYYFLFDRPKFAKGSYWLILLVLSSLGSFLYTKFHAQSMFEKEGLTFPSEAYLGMGLGSFILTALFFALLSIVMKRFSKNNSKIPF